MTRISKGLNHFITANKKVLKFGKNGMNKK